MVRGGKGWYGGVCGSWRRVVRVHGYRTQLGYVCGGTCGGVVPYHGTCAWYVCGYVCGVQLGYVCGGVCGGVHPSWQRRLGIIGALLLEQQRHALGQG